MGVNIAFAQVLCHLKFGASNSYRKLYSTPSSQTANVLNPAHARPAESGHGTEDRYGRSKTGGRTRLFRLYWVEVALKSLTLCLNNQLTYINQMLQEGFIGLQELLTNSMKMRKAHCLNRLDLSSEQIAVNAVNHRVLTTENNPDQSGALQSRQANENKGWLKLASSWSDDHPLPERELLRSSFRSLKTSNCGPFDDSMPVLANLHFTYKIYSFTFANDFHLDSKLASCAFLLLGSQRVGGKPTKQFKGEIDWIL